MAKTPKDAVIDFLRGWENRDFGAMLNAAQPTWLSDIVDPRGHLEKWFGFKRLVEWTWGPDAEIVLGSHARQITVTIEYQTDARRYRHRLMLIVINETPAARNGDSCWGVNPVTALREHECIDA